MLGVTFALEPRELLAIDLANIAGGDTTTVPGPYGVLEAGLTNNGGAGFSVGWSAAGAHENGPAPLREPGRSASGETGSALAEHPEQPQPEPRPDRG